MTGVLLVPSLVSLAWFVIFGGAAIDLQQSGVDIAGAGGVETQLFTTLESFPLSTVAGVVVMVLVALFFVSGADAASIVVVTLFERGSIGPGKPTVIFWGVATGAVAAVMLLGGGTDALSVLQTLTIVAAVPFVLVMIALCVSLVKDLRADPLSAARRTPASPGRGAGREVGLLAQPAGPADRADGQAARGDPLRADPLGGRVRDHGVPDDPRGRQLPDAARQHRQARGRSVPGPRPLQRPGRPDDGHLGEDARLLPGRARCRVPVRPAARSRVRLGRRCPRDAGRTRQVFVGVAGNFVRAVSDSDVAETALRSCRLAVQVSRSSTAPTRWSARRR